MSAMSRLHMDVQDLLEEGFTPAEIARILNIEESIIDPRAFDTLWDPMDDFEQDDGFYSDRYDEDLEDDYVVGCDPAEDSWLEAAYEDRYDLGDY